MTTEASRSLGTMPEAGERGQSSSARLSSRSATSASAPLPLPSHPHVAFVLGSLSLSLSRPSADQHKRTLRPDGDEHNFWCLTTPTQIGYVNVYCVCQRQSADLIAKQIFRRTLADAPFFRVDVRRVPSSEERVHDIVPSKRWLSPPPERLEKLWADRRRRGRGSGCLGTHRTPPAPGRRTEQHGAAEGAGALRRRPAPLAERPT